MRVRNVGLTDSSASVAAAMAVGPATALILGARPSLAVALPVEGGLPAVFDASLSDPAASAASHDALRAVVAPWSAVVAPDDGWLVAALSVTAMEALSTFHERVSAALGGLESGPGRLLPVPWEERRRDVREHGLPIDHNLWEALVRHAAGIAVEPPAAIG